MTALIELQGVGFQVTQPVPIPIVHPLDLTIHEGSSVAIVGPSGAGKTTLASLIGALQPPTEGSYRFAGREITVLRPRDRARFRSRDLGFVFQNSHLMDERSALSNVALGITEDGIPRKEQLLRAEEALETVGLGNVARRQAGLMSGGERHRVAIARAIVKRPRLLIADEPTAALDQRTGRAILDLLAKTRDRGTTLIVVSHDQRAADMADDVVSIVDGRLV